MKKILLAFIIFISVLSIAYSQCTKPRMVAITSPTTTCQGAAVLLSGNVTVTGAPQNSEFTYTWLKAGIPLTTPSSIIIPEDIATNVPVYAGITGIMADAGDYVLRVEDGNTGNAACYTEASVVLTVNSKPNNNFCCNRYGLQWRAPQLFYYK